MRHVIRLIALLVIVVAHPAYAKEQGAAAPAENDVLKVTAKPVKIDTGLVRGLVVGAEDSVHCYKGIPYAAPPLGELRWREPQPAKAWLGVRECYEFGPAAPQRPSPMLSNYPGMALGAATSEDCLYLNVWTPAKRSEKALPVMVWIHGGGYIMGAASQRLYDATDLARRGVVVVSMNYRLGPLGFLAHPQLTAESAHHASGNYGLLDQIAALGWVQRNAAAFGGDPNRVTIFGESAGGGSVFSLLACPLAKGVFHRAIAESGPSLNYAHLNKSSYGFTPAERMGVEFAKQCGAPEGPEQLSALRAMPVEDLMKAAPGIEEPREFNLRGGMLRFAPIVDGWAIPDDPMMLFAEGKQNQVPLIVGSNGDEGTMFMLMAKLPKTVEGWNAAMDKNFGSQSELLRKLYPVAASADIRRAATELLGDFVFGAPARFVARQMAKGSAPVYLYRFDHAPPATGKLLGAHHAAEIAFVLDNLELVKGVSPVDEKLRDALSAYWVQFATTGDPNSEGLTPWPALDDVSDRCLLVQDTIEAAEIPSKERLDAIDAFMDAWRAESGVAGENGGSRGK